KFLASYLKDAATQVRTFDLNGEAAGTIQLPGLGTAGGFKGSRKDNETFYAYLSFAQPAAIYRYDLATGKSTAFKEPELKFNAADFITEQVFAAGEDGIKVPMFITYKRGLRKN